MVKFTKQTVIVGLIPSDILTWMNGPHEIDARSPAGVDKFADFLGLVRRIRQAPVRRTVIWVVFRTIYIIIQLILAVKVNQRKTHKMAPWSAVKPLNHSAMGQFRPVKNLHLSKRYRRVGKQLTQGLQSIERTRLVITGNRYTLAGNAQAICA